MACCLTDHITVCSPTAWRELPPILHGPRAPTHTQGHPTVPSLLGDEFDTNPFLRPQDPAIRQAVGVPADAPDWHVFGAVRAAKDKF